MRQNAELQSVPRWAPNVTGEKNVKAENRTGNTPHKNPTLYHVALKAGLYRKAVPVCYIPIPCDRYILELSFEIILVAPWFW